MSENMKACSRCRGTGLRRRWSHEDDDWTAAECKACKCTGLVPDVEASLRAEVIRLTETLENRDAEIEITRKAAGDAVDSLRAEVTRLAGQLKDWQESYQRQDKEVIRLTEDLFDERKALWNAQADFEHALANRDQLLVRLRESENRVEGLEKQCEDRHAHEVLLENEKLRMYDEHSRLVRVFNEEAHKSAVWWAAEVEKRDREILRLRGANEDDLI